MTTREQLEKELSRFSSAQLDSIVLGALKEQRELFTMAENLKAIITALLDELEQQEGKLIRFLIFMRENFQRAELKGAIDDYFNERMGIAIATPDPYNDLVVFGEPFVDRHDLRVELRLFFNRQVNSVLVTQGPRFSGRSHARLLIQNITKNLGTNVIILDLLNKKVDELITEIINEMLLPVKEFRDRLAQDSSQTKGFSSAFRGQSREFAAQGKKWCIVFDSHDIDGVSPEVRDFVEVLVTDAADNRLQNVWIIVLGHGPWTSFPSNLYHRITDVSTVPLVPSDVEKFLVDLALRNGQPLSKAELAERKTKVFKELKTPLDLEGLRTMSSRLREFIN